MNYHILEGGLHINNTLLCNFLGIQIDDVKSISQNFDGNTTHFFITLKSEKVCCPYCLSKKIFSKGYVVKHMKHALFINKHAEIHLSIKRFRCEECGKSFYAKQDFAPKKSKVSMETIITVLDALRKYTCTFDHAAKIAHVSNTTAMNIFDRYVNPKRKTLPKVIAIDEVYNKGLFSYPYSCVLFDFLNFKIVDVIQDRSKASLSRFLNRISKKERENVEYVVIDMWEPYVDIAKFYFPNAVIAIDSFHVLKEMNSALDKIRCKVMNKYEKGTTEYYLLKKHNDLLFKSPDEYKERIKNPRLKRYVNEYDVLQMILSLDNELKDVYEFTKNYRSFNALATFKTARNGFEKYKTNIKMTRIKLFSHIIEMLNNWEEYILNSFTIVDGRRLSNGPIEGCNSQIKKLMRISNGLENPARFRNRLMHCYNNEAVLSPTKERIVKIKRKPRGKYRKSHQESSS